MRLALLLLSIGIVSTIFASDSQSCASSLGKLGKPPRKLYASLLSTNQEALVDTKINTTFPSPNMFSPAPEKWLAPDREYKEQVAARKKLYEKRPADILKIHPGQEQAVKEAAQEYLEMTATHLASTFPNQFVKENNSIKSLETGETFSLDPNVGPHPLEKLGLLLQDDVTVNVKTPEGKVILAGGFLATPTNWSLQDFIGMDVHAIHANVPKYEAKLKKTVDGAVEKGIKGKCIARNNWLLVRNPELALPSYRRSTFKKPTITADNIGQNLYLRSELESIVNLPNTGATIFTIRPRVWNMEFIRDHAPEVAKNLSTAIKNPDSGYSEVEWKDALIKYFGVSN